MSSRARLVVILVAVVAASWLLWRGLDAYYLRPRATLVSKIADANATLTRHREAKADNSDVAREIASIVDRTLGGDLETVDHRLRTRLNRIAEQSRLQGVSVGTEGGGKAKSSPARSMFRAYRALRDEIDFTEVQGWISGVGALADVVRLMTAIEAEPWIKRIDQVRLDPRDNGARVNVSLRLTTLYLPGRQPRVEPPVQQPSDELQSRFAALVSGNPFRVPPAAQPDKPDPPAVPAPAQPTPPFPFGEWALTGVASGPEGAEAWVLHTPSGETRVLAAGEAIDAMTFTGTSEQAARFTFNGQTVSVPVGSRLDQVRPVG